MTPSSSRTYLCLNTRRTSRAFRREAERRANGFPPALPPVYGTASAGAAAIQQTLFSGLVGIDPSLGLYGDLARAVAAFSGLSYASVGASGESLRG